MSENSYTLAFDFETSKVPHHMPYHHGSYASLLCTRRSTGETQEWWFTHDDKLPPTKDTINEIQQEFDGASRIIGHNIKFDLHWLQAIGIEYEHLNLYCTMVGEYLITGQRPESLRLSELCNKYNVPHKLDKVALYWDNGYDTHEIPVHILSEYCHRDVFVTHLIFFKQLKLLRKLSLIKLAKTEMELIKSIVAIESNGLKIDKENLTDMSKRATIELEALDKQLKAILGDINLGSNQQLSCALFGGVYKLDGTETVTKMYKAGPKKVTRKCKIDKKLTGIFKPTHELGKTGYYPVGADVIAGLKAKTDKQKLVKKLLQQRSNLAKLKSTYYDGLLEREIDGYVYGSVNQCLAVTGRFTSSNPNLQNMPRDKESGVKGSIVSRYKTKGES